MGARADGQPGFSRRVGIVVVVGVALLAALGLLVAATQAVLVVFAGILGGILLDGLTSWVHRVVPGPRGIALALVVLALTGVVVGLGLLVGPHLSEQFVRLSEELPPAADKLATTFAESRIGGRIVDLAPPWRSVVSNGQVLDTATQALGATASGFFAALFIGVLSLFLAAGPHAYVEPSLRLVPPRHRGKIRNLVELVAHNLRWWLVARFISMLTVGVLTGLGLWAAGIPAAASLGVLAGALSFVPNLGPVLAAVPGILLGLAEGPMTAGWALAVYVGVQLLEGNLVTPMAERSAVSLPPALTITAQLLLGLLAGPIGLLVATPLLAVGVLAVRELYVVPMETHADDTVPIDEADSAD